MSLYRDLTNRPWDDVGLPDGIDPRPAFNTPNEKVALVTFIAVACVLFSLLLVAYLMRIRLGMGDWVPVPIPNALWWNTAALIMSSALLQGAVYAARREDRVSFLSVSSALSLAGGVFALLFIAGQAMVWEQFVQAGLGVRGNPANSFFFLLTGIHVLHLAGGIFVWLRQQFRVSQGASLAQRQLSLELCAWYWHFLLLVWAGLFYLLIAT